MSLVIHKTAPCRDTCENRCMTGMTDMTDMTDMHTGCRYESDVAGHDR
jgi:hypothetical protein